MAFSDSQSFAEWTLLIGFKFFQAVTVCFLATIAKNGPISVSFFNTKGELNHRLSQTDCDIIS